jgi:hypothetical protein
LLSPALTALLLLAGPARADDATAPPPEMRDMAPAKATPGWTHQGNSLVLYGPDGDLIQELPLRAPDPESTVSRETLGGAAPDGRLAWTLDRKLVWSSGRTKLLESHRQFKAYGTSGQELWHEDSVDLPERGDPVFFAADGKSLWFARHADDGWYAEARDWMGRTTGSLGPFPRLISIALTPNGRYALARWAVPDASDTHTFLDLQTKARKDVQSSDLMLGLARIGDDGVARSGSRVVYDFNASTAAAPVPPAPPATSTAPATAVKP